MSSHTTNPVYTRTINGTTGNDTLLGDAGNDRMFGGAGIDGLFGSDGHDWLDGGAGADLLAGGRGGDVFYFGSALDAHTDLIIDFRKEDGDLIDLGAIDANPSVAGDQAFTWIGNAEFTAVGQLRYLHVPEIGSTAIVGNTTGDVTPEFFISVIGLVAFAPSDFLSL